MTKLGSAMAEYAIQSMVGLAAATPPGPLVEVGVWRGGSAQALYQLAEQQDRALWLFDTFTGIPTKSVFDMHNVGDFSDGVDLDAIRKAMPEARIMQGIFPGTLPAHLDHIAFVHEDTDQYESTRSVIEHLYHKLVPGGIMLFDDYHTGDCPGSKKAIDESGLKLEFIHGKAFTRKP